MINLKHLLFSIITLFVCATGTAQTISRYNTFNYNVNDGLLQSTIGDVCFDANNFCWISFPNGIQKFDGRHFTDVPIQHGLPDDKLCHFFRCKHGDLLVSHSYGISRYEIDKDRLVQIFTYKAGQNNPAIFIGEDDGTVYFYQQTGTITGVNCRTFNIVSEVQTGFPDYSNNGDYRPAFSDNIVEHRVAFMVNSNLFLWDLNSGKLISQSKRIAGLGIFFLHLQSRNKVLYFTSEFDNALQLYNFPNGKTTAVPVAKNTRSASRSRIYKWQNKNLFSIGNRLYEIGSSLDSITSELVNFDNEPVAGSSTIAKMSEDNFGNLYIVTVTGGIRKVISNNYPVKYFNAGKSQNNFTLCILPDKNHNRIITGTAGNGLLIFDTLQNLVKHIKLLPGTSEGMYPNCIIKTKNGYLIWMSGETRLWHLSEDLEQLKPIAITSPLPEGKTGINYFATCLFQDDNRAIVQSQEKLYDVNLSTYKVTEKYITAGYIMGGLLYKKMIITHGNDQLIYLDANTLEEIKSLPFKNTGYVRSFAKDVAGNIYIGSNKGIFKINDVGKILQHLNKDTGLPDECIYAMAFDDEGLLWCSTNKGIFRLNKDNSILQLKKDDGLQENEFNTNSVGRSENGEIYFGGVNGVSSFYPSAIKNHEEEINILITGIKINNKERFDDTAVWQINNLELSHTQNSIAFDFVAMANNNPGQYIYQYRMKGVDEQWIQNEELQTVRYFLHPGKYVFQLYASRFFDKDAKPMKEITIIIHPPFWQTWWFIGGVLLLFTLLMGFIINGYIKAKYRRKMVDIESEYKIQMERERISRDLHDNIGAYANAVLYNSELLQREEEQTERKKLMNDLKFASKDIIVSLRETVWALKKDEYSAQDCLLRIRNFIQPLTRYYHNIKFTIEGDAPANMVLHSTRALNLVRMVQEAISNALKHSGTGSITIISLVEDDKWTITVADDGPGFDYESMKNSQGNGLNNMKQRSDGSGFELTIDTQPGKGTSIKIVLKKIIQRDKKYSRLL